MIPFNKPPLIGNEEKYILKSINSPKEHGVTILDLLFNVGSDATKYMKSFE